MRSCCLLGAISMQGNTVCWTCRQLAMNAVYTAAELSLTRMLYSLLLLLLDGS
jgi:hypothetical protein